MKPGKHVKPMTLRHATALQHELPGCNRLDRALSLQTRNSVCQTQLWGCQFPMYEQLQRHPAVGPDTARNQMQLLAIAVKA